MIQKEKPSFLHMRWSEADDNLLKELISKGCNATQISEVLGRTRSSIFGRKLVLGIPGKIKRTGKGKASPLTWGERAKRKVEFTPEIQFPEVVDEVQAEIPATPETTKVKTKVKAAPATEGKGKTNKIPYNVKLAQTNLRRRRGDIRKVAKATGFSEGFVSTVVNGIQDNEKIMSVFYNMVRGRKTNESMMKK